MLKKIFTELVNWYSDNNGYDNSIKKTALDAVTATLAVYTSSLSFLRPTPSKSHYKFNLRDFSAVIQGITLIHPDELYNSDRLVKLWVHETYRVFYDRLGY